METQMSATADLAVPTVSAVEGTVKEQRKAYGAGARQAIREEKRAAITAGLYLKLAKDTFTQDEKEEWQAWAKEATRKSMATVDQYIAVAKVYSASTKSDQRKIADWPFESLQAFSTVPEEDRKDVLAAVLAEDSHPAPELVRTARDIAKDERLSPEERTAKEAARAKREKDGKAEKTETARKALASFIGTKGPASKSPEALVLIGVQLGIAHGEEHANAGTKAYFANLAKLAENLAKRDAAKEAKSTAKDAK